MSVQNVARCLDGHIVEVRNVQALSDAEYGEWASAYEAFLNGIKRPCCEQAVKGEKR